MGGQTAKSGVFEEIGVAVDNWSTSLPLSTLRFLTHAHADHMGGLHAGWSGAPFYCSLVTKSIVEALTGLHSSKLIALPYYRSTVVTASVPRLSSDDPLEALRRLSSPSSTSDDTTTQMEMKVTLLPAYHCAGAAMFVFETPRGNFLHTGDFRAGEALLYEPVLKTLKFRKIVFDDTYFPVALPPRQVALESVLQTALDVLSQYPAIPLVIGVDRVGKEEILILLSIVTRKKVWAPDQRLEIAWIGLSEIIEILKSLVSRSEGLASYLWKAGVAVEVFEKSPKELYEDIFTDDHEAAGIFALPRCKTALRPMKLLDGVLSRRSVIIPSGWAATEGHQDAEKEAETILEHGGPLRLVPYTIHSSREELLNFLASIDFWNCEGLSGIRYSREGHVLQDDIAEPRQRKEPTWNIPINVEIVIGGGTSIQQTQNAQKGEQIGSPSRDTTMQRDCSASPNETASPAFAKSSAEQSSPLRTMLATHRGASRKEASPGRPSRKGQLMQAINGVLSSRQGSSGNPDSKLLAAKTTTETRFSRLRHFLRMQHLFRSSKHIPSGKNDPSSIIERRSEDVSGFIAQGDSRNRKDAQAVEHQPTATTEVTKEADSDDCPVVRGAPQQEQTSNSRRGRTELLPSHYPQIIGPTVSNDLHPKKAPVEKTPNEADLPVKERTSSSDDRAKSPPTALVDSSENGPSPTMPSSEATNTSDGDLSKGQAAAGSANTSVRNWDDDVFRRDLAGEATSQSPRLTVSRGRRTPLKGRSRNAAFVAAMSHLAEVPSAAASPSQDSPTVAEPTDCLRMFVGNLRTTARNKRLVAMLQSPIAEACNSEAAAENVTVSPRKAPSVGTDTPFTATLSVSESTRLPLSNADGHNAVVACSPAGDKEERPNKSDRDGEEKGGRKGEGERQRQQQLTPLTATPTSDHGKGEGGVIYLSPTASETIGPSQKQRQETTVAPPSVQLQPETTEESTAETEPDPSTASPTGKREDAVTPPSLKKHRKRSDMLLAAISEASGIPLALRTPANKAARSPESEDSLIKRVRQNKRTRTLYSFVERQVASSTGSAGMKEAETNDDFRGGVETGLSEQQMEGRDNRLKRRRTLLDLLVSPSPSSSPSPSVSPAKAEVTT